jgi:taurine dioxygenase
MTTTHGISYALAPVSPVLGAEVVGIDLANGVDEATAAALREDFWRHKVLVFRNQHLSPDAHVEAVRIALSSGLQLP